MKTLLVATDFSSAADNAVRYAAAYASAINGRLIVFHAAHMQQFNPTINEREFYKLREKGEKKAEEKLRKLVDRIYTKYHLKNKSKVVTVANTGVFAGDMILAMAKNFQADLIVVGTHGASGLKFLGSITLEIVFKANTPVLSVPPNFVFKGIKKIVYATDLRNIAEEMNCIIPLASEAKAALEVLNIDLARNKSDSKEKIEASVKRYGYKKVSVVIEKEKKGLTILEQIEQHLRKSKPDVLVMFPEERSLLDKLFIRSKTEELAYHTEIPLLTINKSSLPL